jgi:hypothetical protein
MFRPWALPRDGQAAARSSQTLHRLKSTSLTDRNRLNAPSIGRHHTLPEERALIMTGRDSVPVASSIAWYIARSIGSSIASSIVVAVFVAAHDDGWGSFVEASSVEATTSIMEATAPETSAFSRSRVCAYGEGG